MLANPGAQFVEALELAKLFREIVIQLWFMLLLYAFDLNFIFERLAGETLILGVFGIGDSERTLLCSFCPSEILIEFGNRIGSTDVYEYIVHVNRLRARRLCLLLC